MLEFLSFLIKTGIEFLFIVILLTNILQLRNLQRLIPYLFYGSIFGGISALFLYLIKKYLVRMELMDVIENGLLFLAIVLCIIWVIFQYTKKKEKGGKTILFLFAFAFMLVRFEFILLSAIPQLSIVNGMNSEWIGKIALTILSVICLYLMALGLKLVGSKISIHLTLFMFFFQSLILFFKELTELAQLLFSLQILPLTMWALEILAPVVNHKDYFFYVLTSSIILFLLYSSFLIYHYLKVKDENFVNPAEKRKSIAKSRKLRRWFYSFVSIQIVFFTFLANVKIIQEKEVMTNPPMEVTAQYGHIHITHEMLHEEKGLNIFSYIFPDQTQARFMVVGKTDENYGVALDACAICGVAGYFQKGNQIICKKCNSVVNVNTIGFTGGCNPIPMTYENQSNGQLDIPVSELEKSKSLFQ